MLPKTIDNHQLHGSIKEHRRNERSVSPRTGCL